MKNMAASVRARLLNRSRATGESFQNLLVRYGIERVLARLVDSDHSERFILKGAMLFYTWTGESHRPTSDLDLLGFGSNEPRELAEVFRAVLAGDVGDGLLFDTDGIDAARIREDNPYQGVRVSGRAYLGSALIPLQIDVGYGDSVTPEPEMIAFPTLLDDHAPPLLRAYRRETVVAEKFEAMVSLGLINTRMKDFFDIYVLARDFAFDGPLLAHAIRQTFDRRGTTLPTTAPVAWRSEFYDDAQKSQQWQAFLKKSRIEAPPLPDVALAIQAFLQPLLTDAGSDSSLQWPPGGPWKNHENDHV